MHPTSRELSAFGLGQLPAEQAASVENHISQCDACCETLLGLESKDSFLCLLQGANQTVGDQTVGFAGEQGLPSPSKVPTPLAGHPRYEILGLIGKGGMGDVFKARHRMMERTVALKVIKQNLVRRPEAVDRFRREVKAAASMSHPNIVTAFDAEHFGDVHFLVMEYVDGVTLDEVVGQKGPLPAERAAEYIRQAATGLQYAHERGMVHRDIKPQNLMLAASGEVKILDFGLANFATEVAGVESEGLTENHDDGAALDVRCLTQLGATMGTPDYIAPEQAQDAHAADIYSLGCTFYCLLTGKAPFRAGTVSDTIRAHSEQEATPISEIRHDVPPVVTAIVRKMMAKTPGERHQTPGEVNAALAQAQAAFATPMPAARGGGMRRSRRIALVLGVLATVLAGVILLTTSQGTLEIRSDVDDLGVVISQGGKEIELKDLATGSTVKRLESGQWEIKLKGDRNDVKLDPLVFTMSRFGKTIVTARLIKEPGGAVETVPSKHPEMELLGEFTGHTNVVRAMRFLPGNERLVSVDGDGNVFVWDAKTKRSIRQFKVAGETYTDADISADGRLLAIASDWGTSKGRLEIWDIAKGAVLHRITHRFGFVEQLRFSADGSKLVAVGSPPVAQLWDVARGTELRTIEPGLAGRQVKSAAFTADGRGVALGAVGQVHLCDVETGVVQQKIELSSRHNVLELVPAPRGRRLAVISGGGPIALIDTKSWTVAQTVLNATAGDGRRAGAFVNEELLVTGSDDGLLHVVSLDGTVRSTAQCGAGGCLNVSVASDARHVVAGGGWNYDTAKRRWTVTSDFKLRMWRVPESVRPNESPKSINLLALIDPARDALDPGIRIEEGVLLTPPRVNNIDTRVMIPYEPIPQEYDLRLVAKRKNNVGSGLNLGFVMGGRQAHVAMDGAGRKSAWCIERIDGKTMHNGNETYVEGKRFHLGQKVQVDVQVRRTGVKVLYDEKVVIDWKGTPEQLSLWDKLILPSPRQLFFFSQAEFAIYELALTPVAAVPPPRAVANEITLLRRFPPANSFNRGVKLTPDGKHVVSVSNDNFLRVHDVASGEMIKGFRAMGGPRGLALLANGGQAIIAGHSESKVERWDLATGKKLQSYDGIIEAFQVAVAAGERTFAVAGSPPELWQLDPPRRVIRLEGHDRGAVDVAFSKDGTRLATAGRDGQVIVWDAATGTEQIRLKGSNAATAIMFLPDGARLLAGYANGELCLWDIATEKRIRRLQGHTLGIRSIVALATGNHALTGADDGTLRLWDLSAGVEISRVKTDRHDANHVDVSPQWPPLRHRRRVLF